LVGGVCRSFNSGEKFAAFDAFNKKTEAPPFTSAGRLASERVMKRSAGMFGKLVGRTERFPSARH
jgi:hypothetical protein